MSTTTTTEASTTTTYTITTSTETVTDLSLRSRSQNFHTQDLEDLKVLFLNNNVVKTQNCMSNKS